MERVLTRTKKKINILLYHKFSWENAFVNSIRKVPFTGPNKDLADTLVYEIHEPCILYWMRKIICCFLM